MLENEAESVIANPLFKRLVDARSRLGWILTVLMLVIYYGFVLLIAFDKGTLGTVVLGTVTSLGIIVGLCVLVSAFVLVAIYVAIANSKFDRMTQELRRELGR